MKNTEDKTIITREMLTQAMKAENRIQKVNEIICPHKAKNPNWYRGASLGKIVVTPECFWSTLLLPQWVKKDDTVYPWRFYCTEDGKFIDWVRY